MFYTYSEHWSNRDTDFNNIHVTRLVEISFLRIMILEIIIFKND